MTDDVVMVAVGWQRRWLWGWRCFVIVIFIVLIGGGGCVGGNDLIVSFLLRQIATDRGFWSGVAQCV
jgi:hypothetical protein